MRLLLIGLITVCIFTGCAKKNISTEGFKPLQLHWVVFSGQSEDDLVNNDECIVRLTANLMSQPLVVASLAEELEYQVIYGMHEGDSSVLSNNPYGDLLDNGFNGLYFEGVCKGGEKSPECKWAATCDRELNIVVKFYNGD